MKNSNRFLSKTFVKSHYRAQWVGLILKREVCKYQGKQSYVCTCLHVQDANGNLVKRRNVSVLSERWLTPHDPVDITHINREWMKA